ncbi:MAG TPA: helix-hairpin-helix domain-containing protein [Ktedonobacteraceae bacterium]|nr:helix-hairpin-helix domain-containing protein [Ktedonobacteraceae bacterium]
MNLNIMQLTQTIHLVPPTSSRPDRLAAQPTLPGLELEPVEKPAVTNRQIAEVLSNIAEILELQNANPYRIQAYRNAARGVLELDESASVILERGGALPVAGLGQRLRSRITELVENGTMTFYNDLCLQALPRGVRSLMAIHFVGVHTAIRLYEELEIDSPEKLHKAALQQRIRKLPGFGARSEARLKEATEQFLTRKAPASLNGVA